MRTRKTDPAILLNDVITQKGWRVRSIRESGTRPRIYATIAWSAAVGFGIVVVLNVALLIKAATD